ncbi:MAG: SDR family oxidoreductase [Planctomycetota bacterium]
MRLRNKVAVVTGGGTGIGLSVAHALSGEGCRVAIAGRRVEKLREALNGWPGGEPPVHHRVDVADRSSVHELFAWVRQQLGDVDILVNSAGINVAKRSMAAMDPADWDRVLAVNATGAYNCMHGVLPAMRARQDGLIINISSVAGKRALTLAGVAYCASKFAMTALGTTVGNEVAADGVRVTNVYPGEVNTPILDNRPAPVSDERKAAMVQPEDFAELIVAVACLHPRAHVSEITLKPRIQELS